MTGSSPNLKTCLDLTVVALKYSSLKAINSCTIVFLMRTPRVGGRMRPATCELHLAVMADQ